MPAKSSRPASARHPRKNTNPEWQQAPSTAPFHRAQKLLQKSVSKNFLALTKNASANSSEPAPTVHYTTFLREKHSLSGEYTATSTTAGAAARRDDHQIYRLAESSRPASGMPTSMPGCTLSPRNNYVDRVNSRMRRLLGISQMDSKEELRASRGSHNDAAVLLRSEDTVTMGTPIANSCEHSPAARMLGSTCGIVSVEITSPRKFGTRGGYTAKVAAAYGAESKTPGSAHRANSRSL